MYKGVERDEARQAAKRAQREADLIANQERKQAFEAMQPTVRGGKSSGTQSQQRTVAAYAIVEGAEDKAGALKGKAEDKVHALKDKAQGFLQNVGGIGDDEDRRYIAGRWGLNGLQIAACAATPLYALSAVRKGGFSLRRLARAK